MNDLISRSELLKQFLVNKDWHRIPERDCDNLEVFVSKKMLRQSLRSNQPPMTLTRLLRNWKREKNIMLKC